MTLEFSRVVITVPLVAMSAAKDHLHVTDTTHDADISAKLEAAQEYVIGKLFEAADASWTETTVPRVIRHAILLMLDGLYERRGGEEGAEPLRKTLDVVDLLIALYRDPTLA